MWRIGLGLGDRRDAAAVADTGAHEVRLSLDLALGVEGIIEAVGGRGPGHDWGDAQRSGGRARGRVEARLDVQLLTPRLRLMVWLGRPAPRRKHLPTGGSRDLLRPPPGAVDERGQPATLPATEEAVAFGQPVVARRSLQACSQRRQAPAQTRQWTSSSTSLAEAGVGAAGAVDTLVDIAHPACRDRGPAAADASWKRHFVPLLARAWPR
jgi:hypothetical protein